MLNIYIYHHLPPTYFGVCYTIFSVTIVLVLLAQKLFAFRNIAIKCTVYRYILYFIATLQKGSSIK